MDPFAFPVLEYIGVPGSELVSCYQSERRWTEVELNRTGESFGIKTAQRLSGMSHARLTKELLRPHGLLGWRIFTDAEACVYSGTLWLCHRSLARVMHADAAFDPRTPGGLVWYDARYLASEIRPLGLLWQRWVPTGTIRVLDGENFVKPGPGLEDLPPEDQLPAPQAPWQAA